MKVSASLPAMRPSARTVRYRSAVVAQASANRRVVLGQVASAASLLLQQFRPALADEVAVTTPAAPAPASGPAEYLDPNDRFFIAVPAGWGSGEGMIDSSSKMGLTGARRTVAWFPASQGAATTNVSVVVTNTSFEFTNMGSFGTIDTWAENLVNSLDRSWDKFSAGPVQIARLVNAKAVTVPGASDSKGYVVEYTVQRPGETEPRHLLSVATISPNKYYNRLYTATAQCLESEYPRYKAELEGAIKSFKLVKA